MQLEIVLACGVLALLYGLWTIRSVLSLPAGNARMQEIAAAIQEGARAYLNRQYTTIAMVGVVIFALAFFFLGWQVAFGFLIGATLSGAAGRAPGCRRARQSPEIALRSAESRLTPSCVLYGLLAYLRRP